MERMRVLYYNLVKIISLIVLMAVIAACGASDDEAAPTAPAAQPTTAVATAKPAEPTAVIAKMVAGEPIYGGEFVYRGRLENWDVTKTSSTPNLDTVQRIYSQLLMFSPEDGTTLLPDLAKSWDISGDGTVYTVNLNEGITWHDGKPFTAADVVFSYNRWKTVAGLPRAAGLKDIESIEQIDPLTVKITIPTNPLFLHEMASGWHVVGPKHIYELEEGVNRPERVIGTGPFKIEAGRSDKSVAVYTERNVDYWKKDANGNSMPYLDRVVSLNIPDATARDAAFRTKKMHMLPSTGHPPELANQLKKDLGDKINLVIAPGWPVHISFNHTRAPFDDPNVRKALSYSLDRVKLARLGLKQPRIATDYFEPDPNKCGTPEDQLLQWPGYSSPPRPEDLELAKKLIKEAGLEGLEFTILTHPFWADTVGLAIADWEKIGIKGTLETVDGATLAARGARQEFDMLFRDTAGLYQHPDAVIGMLYLPGRGRNEGKWVPPDRWMELYEQESALPLGDPNKCEKLAEMNTITHEEWLPLIIVNYVAVHHLWWDFVKNYEYHSLYNWVKFDHIWVDQ
jgi:peptide/nickel transport system substrate-binding protein